ncbi:MAG: hypothetical protein V4628_02650 [Pseudomonadota bacterium]
MKQKFTAGRILPGLFTGACIGLLLVRAATAAEAVPEIAGLWQMPQCPSADGSTGGGGFNRGCMEVAEDDEKLTDRAKAYHEATDEAAQPKYDCAPMPIPMMWSEPYDFAIEQLEDRVLIRYGKEEVVRTVWLEGHGFEEPQYNEFFYYGHSVGRYENGALLVVTDRFTFDPQGWNADDRIPSSTQKQLFEKFSMEGDNLVLEVIAHDTFFLKEPLTYRVTALPETMGWDFNWDCDLDASRSILKIMEKPYPNDPTPEYIDYQARP